MHPSTTTTGILDRPVLITYNGTQFAGSASKILPTKMFIRTEEPLPYEAEVMVSLAPFQSAALSPDGCRVFGEGLAPSDEAFALSEEELTEEGASGRGTGRELEFSAVVRWRRSDGIGIEYGDLRPKDLHALYRYLQEASSESEGSQVETNHAAVPNRHSRLGESMPPSPNDSSPESNCPVLSALRLLGDRQSIRLMRYLRSSGTRTREEIEGFFGRQPKASLPSRLARLQQYGIVSQDLRSDGMTAYALTSKGAGILSIVRSMVHWANEPIQNHVSAAQL
ncbi:MAG: winged helix-turn-helix transcriptional regulator [Myxococcota bacterium]